VFARPHPGTITYEQLIASMSRRAHLSAEEAEASMGAVLGTLAERLSRGERHHFGQQLPIELSVWLFDNGENAEPFDVDEFVRRIAEREGTDVRAAEEHARAVFSTLRDAVGRDRIEHLLRDLPETFRPILLNYALMPAAEIIRKVAARAALDDRSAGVTTGAVLETLAERIPAGEVRDLMGRLPIALHEPLRRRLVLGDEHATAISAAEFVRRVAVREGGEKRQRRTPACVRGVRDPA
jgi:uncharacterized protein (DUF2267 family)